jgi:hypothetical protein
MFDNPYGSVADVDAALAKVPKPVIINEGKIFPGVRQGFED